ncbi:PI-PLC X domain-containing protein 1-like [Periophthalmus magnuspinnatus]|uniref:PI-PLC X domain-containing protein 1-like n=1 Tax=Periophthalmus magnuspinnatus TaxID=409849 RepID=UPI002436A7A2|nr:PI-PLC X domain-containing protein 1-like [Periophthalmus magnuspinnatus]
MAPGRKKQNQVQKDSYSDWMLHLPPEKHTIALWHLVIPGSHDSMTYDLDINSPIIEPDMLKKYSNLRCVRSIMRNWGRTQEANILEQLNAGARYFDLRIARKENDPDPNRLYFYHGLLTRTDVETVLRSINEWAEQHPKEVIILALSHFKGFGSNEVQLHNHLTAFIKNLFGSKLVPKPIRKEDTPTLQKCWDEKQNVIVSYDYYEANKQSVFWFKIVYFYGDGMDLTKVEERLTRNLRAASREYFYVCGLNLTLPENAGALKYVFRWRSLASAVRHSLPTLQRWIQTQAAKSPLNIVASDLVTEGNLVTTIVNLNETSE